MKVGSKLSFRAGPTAFHGRVGEFKEHDTLRFSGKSPGSSATCDFRLESDGENTNVVAAANMGGLAIMAARPIMQGITERAVLHWLDALAAAV